MSELPAQTVQAGQRTTMHTTPKGAEKTKGRKTHMTREAFDFIHDECEIEAYEERCRDKSVVCECDRCGGDIYEWDTMERAGP